MATATMGLRRRVQVGNSSSVAQGSGSKRTRSENNNSPSQGNLNSLGSSEPAPKKSRTSSRSAAAKAKELELAKKAAINGPPHWSDPRPYASIAGLTLEAQRALIPESLPSPIAFMSTSMATFVGNATNLGKSSSVSYLDISNMTARPPGWPGAESADGKGPLALPFTASSLTGAGAFTSTSKSQSSSTASQASAALALKEQQSSQHSSAANQLPKNFPNDAMFNAYQPWVIKTYGDLAKTKTITIKKYARILRTLRGEEVNSAENSKFRFWVKSKGFHIGQPEGYEAKPADRIIGRHAVTNPGLDPPLYVPTQPPHNKALNGAEGTVPPGRVYKKVAIVENFFDIIHAVHVDLEGRPGKHAGQKRTYRTITETYAFLPREAVTRFLLGCTECQRRPRTPSPTSLAVSTSAPSPPTPASTPTPTATTPTPPATTAAEKPSLTPVEKPASPKPAAVPSPSPDVATKDESEKPKEASQPPKSKSPAADIREQQPEPKSQEDTAATTTTVTTTIQPASTSFQSSISTDVKSKGSPSLLGKPKIRDEKYNPLSITNLLRKDPPMTRRPLLPIITTTYQHIPEPLTTTTTATTTAATSCSAAPENAGPSTTVGATAAIPKKMRILPEDHVRRSTPSPRAAAGLPRPWSPSPDAKCAPIDYSLPIASAYHKHQQHAVCSETAPRRTASETSPKEAETAKTAEPMVVPTPAASAEAPLAAATTKTESSSESESEAEDERGFSPAAGLIDTNLNLLATIQQLHCQVMLALTERLRPPVSGSPSATPASASHGSHGTGNQDS